MFRSVDANIEENTPHRLSAFIGSKIMAVIEDVVEDDAKRIKVMSLEKPRTLSFRKLYHKSLVITPAFLR